MTATGKISSSRNKTGVFIADALQEVNPQENQLVVIPPTTSSRSRTSRSAKLLLALSERKHHKIQEFSSSQRELQQAQTVDESKRLQNSFRPSTIRRQKTRLISAVTHQNDYHPDFKGYSSKQVFTPSPASAKLKAEIDHISSKLKLHDDTSRASRFPQHLDINGTPLSSLSYFTTYRPSSASTSPPTGRLNQQISSTIKNGITNTIVSMPGATSKKTSRQIGSSLSAPIDEDYSRRYLNPSTVHTYQIPQQSNIGSHSNLSSHSPPISTRKASAKHHIRNDETKTILCPFYVMYFTNLTMQQRHSNNTKPKIPSPLPLTTNTPRKDTVHSRLNTSYSRQTTGRRQMHSPISMCSRSTIDDDDDDDAPMVNTSAYYDKKRFSAKITAFENENSHLLKDVLRTTAWNHVQM